jgi:hypothetical protein
MFPRNWSHEANLKQGPVMAYAPLISAVGTAFSAISSLTQKQPKAPRDTASAPTVMPTQDSALVMDAKRRALIAQTERGGRNSTILTDSDNETFGGN